MAESHNIDVLIIEDDPDVLDMMVLLLEAEGYPVMGATNGREALTYLQISPKPHCILLDVEMPVMDGPSFRRAQQSDPDLAQIPVILLSASHKSQEIATELQVAAWLQKPFAPTELLKLVKKFCHDTTTDAA